MSRNHGTHRVSALKRLGKSSIINNINRRQLFAEEELSAKPTRNIVVNRGSPYDHHPMSSSPYDIRQIPSSPYRPVLTNTIPRKSVETVNNEKEKVIVVTGLKNTQLKDGRIVPTTSADNNRREQNKNIFAIGSSTFVTIRNNNNVNIGMNPTQETVSLTKTITNTALRRGEEADRLNPIKHISTTQSNQQLRFSVVNDKYQKTLTTMAGPSNSPPLVKHLHDAGIQTTPTSFASRSPIRTNAQRQLSSNTMEDQDRTITRTIDEEFYEPPSKRTTCVARKTTTDREHTLASTIATNVGSMKRTSAGTPVTANATANTSTTSKPAPTAQCQSIPGTVLVTNLLPSVSNEDVIELFTQIGRVNQITKLSAGCIEILYTKREDAEQAVARYHNRLLDGQFMYVSLQQTAPPPSPPVVTQASKPTNHVTSKPPSGNTHRSTKQTESSTNASSTTVNQPLKFNTTSTTSNKGSLDPTFIRQALFNPSNNTHPVQFQVKL
ncbi:unnamed protein product [Adineta ricciae]|uniref:RRM domain-containing protein n=1 Tax=Adineta ricciae TaxID=249248 RepID=A0A815IHE3_ADIRI|nr:unnamed protein product [Adineta ricciae]